MGGKKRKEKLKAYEQDLSQGAKANEICKAIYDNNGCDLCRRIY